jgi:putative tricarboxylic transport membrane protein
MKQSMVVINKSGGAGGEGFLDVKGSKGNPHKLVITLSNLFTTPLGTGIPFYWKDLTPVAMMALDEFILWVPGGHAVQDCAGLHRGRRRPNPASSRWAVPARSRKTRSSRSRSRRRPAPSSPTSPYKGGGEVAVQLVGKHVNSTVNNPIEAVAQWRAGQLQAALRVRQDEPAGKGQDRRRRCHGPTFRPARARDSTSST